MQCQRHEIAMRPAFAAIRHPLRAARSQLVARSCGSLHPAAWKRVSSTSARRTAMSNYDNAQMRELSVEEQGDIDGGGYIEGGCIIDPITQWYLDWLNGILP
jgi:hypothetical protein